MKDIITDSYNITVDSVVAAH